MAKSNNTTFIKITNQDIYKKLCDVENHVIKTNGKVNINTIISRIAVTISLLAISIIGGVIIF